MRMVREELAPLKNASAHHVTISDSPRGKGGRAFALLAYQTWRQLPSKSQQRPEPSDRRDPGQSQLCVGSFSPRRARRTRKNERSLTTETQSHGEKPGKEKQIKLDEFGRQPQSCYRRNTRPRSLCLRVSVVELCAVAALLLASGCAPKPDPNTLVMVIESSPTNLDPTGGGGCTVGTHR